MKLSAAAVRRPVATAMVFVALTVVGLFAYLQLKVDLFPEIDFPSISVVTRYAGVSPEEMETLITRPIEAAVSRVEGIDRLESYSSEGFSRVALRFEWGIGLEEALNDVRAAVERTREMMPDEAEAPVVYKFDLTNLPVLYLGLSANMTEAELQRFSEEVVQPYLERASGVASVDTRGAREREIRIEIDTARLSSLELTPVQVVNALRNESLTVPAGQVERGAENVLIRAMGEFESLDEVAQSVVGWRSGSVDADGEPRRVPVQVADVATVVDGFEQVINIVRINGAPGVMLTVSKTPGANTVEVVDGLREVIDRFNTDYEGEATLTVLVDSSTFIRRSISSVQASVLIGAGLALVVLFFFLQSVRSTVVIGVAIPISVIATFMLMYQLDLSLNLITFGGVALGIGMLVDNAIVILENIYRHRENGVESKAAAIKGSDEVASAIVASTMTTLSVFLPVVFLGGFAAIFFGQMALVVASALLCSLFVALTLVPVLSSVLLKRVKSLAERKPNPMRRALDGLDSGYSTLVRWALRLSPLVIVIAVASLVGAWQLTDQIGSEVLPESDESEVRIFAQYPSGTRIEVTEQAVIDIERIVRELVPEATDIQATIGQPGFWSTSGEESASLRVNLVAVEERERSSEEVAAALRPVLMRELPGMRVFARAGGGLWIFSFLRGGDDSIRVEVHGHDLDTADELAGRVTGLVQGIEGVADARPSRERGGRELQLYVDRGRAADYGMSTRQVAEIISLLVQGRDAGVYRERGDEFRIRVRLSDDDLRSTESLLDSPVTIPNGENVQLRDLVVTTDGETPKSIYRLNQQRVVTVSGGLEEGYDLGAVTERIREALRDVETPEGFSLILGGETAEQEDMFGSLLLGMILAVLLVYMVMAGQFESFVQPLVIMASVPFAAIGVLLTLVLTDTTFNINSFMGVIVLVGVVVNNAIVLVDYINLMRRQQGYPLFEAIVESSRRRLRPILMTTLTTTLALLPVAIGAGTGGEAQAPLARVVIGGLISSTLITLFLVPVLYLWTERLKLWVFGAENEPAVVPEREGLPRNAEAALSGGE